MRVELYGLNQTSKGEQGQGVGACIRKRSGSSSSSL